MKLSKALHYFLYWPFQGGASFVDHFLRADLLALLYVMSYCVFVTFPCGVLVWFLIALIPDLCRLSYFSRFIHYLRRCDSQMIDLFAKAHHD